MQDSLFQLQLQLSALDGLELPFLCLGGDGQVVFASSQAARLLDIRDRQAVARHTEHLKPLRDLGLPLLEGEGKENSLLKSQLGPKVVELAVTALNGRQFMALAFVRPIYLSNLETNPGFVVVVFQDLTMFQPFFQTIEQSRRHRAIVIMVSSFLGRSPLLDEAGNELLVSYRAAEKEFFRRSPRSGEELAQTDLQSGLSKAIDIVDPLLVSSSKIICDAKISALLAISQPNFLRIICHLLLEASDFVGPFGTITIKAALHSYLAEGHRAETADQLGISLFAERKKELPLETTPLELYFYRRYMPVHYKISLADDFGEGSEQTTFKEVRFGGHATVAPESLSDNLRIAGQLASACGEELQVKCPQSHLLVLSASFKLHRDHRPAR